MPSSASGSALFALSGMKLINSVELLATAGHAAHLSLVAASHLAQRPLLVAVGDAAFAL